MAFISLFSFEAVVNQTWSPQTTGEDHPLPSMGVFQIMFSESLQVTGYFFPVAIPFSSFPLKWVHELMFCWALMVTATRAMRIMQEEIRDIDILKGL
jgi:hypothetical protein